jgi:hypothetical protein
MRMKRRERRAAGAAAHAADDLKRSAMTAG